MRWNGARPPIENQSGPGAHDCPTAFPTFTRGPFMQRRIFLKRLALTSALAVAGLAASAPAFAADTIKVGILHSLSGTMAISETVLKDVTLMAIDEINAKGGVMGKKL